jgi:hypothetical protein
MALDKAKVLGRIMNLQTATSWNDEIIEATRKPETNMPDNSTTT